MVVAGFPGSCEQEDAKPDVMAPAALLPPRHLPTAHAFPKSHAPISQVSLLYIPCLSMCSLPQAALQHQLHVHHKVVHPTEATAACEWAVSAVLDDCIALHNWWQLMCSSGCLQTQGWSRALRQPAPWCMPARYLTTCDELTVFLLAMGLLEDKRMTQPSCSRQFWSPGLFH